MSQKRWRRIVSLKRESTTTTRSDQLNEFIFKTFALFIELCINKSMIDDACSLRNSSRNADSVGFHRRSLGTNAGWWLHHASCNDYKLVSSLGSSWSVCLHLLAGRRDRTLSVVEFMSENCAAITDFISPWSSPKPVERWRHVVRLFSQTFAVNGRLITLRSLNFETLFIDSPIERPAESQKSKEYKQISYFTVYFTLFRHI